MACYTIGYLSFKGIDLTGLLGGHKRRLGVWGPHWGPGADVD